MYYKGTFILKTIVKKNTKSDNRVLPRKKNPGFFGKMWRKRFV